MNRIRYFLSLIFLLFTPIFLFATIVKNSDSVNIKSPQAISLFYANSELEHSQNTIVEISKNLESQKLNNNIDSIISANTKFLESKYKEIEDINAHSVSKFYLENSSRSWKEYRTKVKNEIDIVRQSIVIFQKDLKKLEFEQEVWRLTLKDLRTESDAPIEVKTRIEKMISQISKLKKKYELEQKKLIIKENKLTDLLILTKDALDRIKLLKEELRSNLFVKTAPPLWKTPLNSTDIYPISTHLNKVLNINRRSVLNYFTEQNILLLIFILILELLIILFIRNRYNKLNLSDNSPGFVNANFILNNKLINSILLLIFVTTLILQQTIPLTFSAILTITILSLSITLIARFAGEKGRTQTIVILAIYILNQAEVIFWYFGFLLRYYIIVEALTVMILTYLIVGLRLRKASKDSAPIVKSMTIILGFVFWFFAIALAADVFGFLNLASLLTKIAAKIPVIIFIVFLTYRILEVLILAGCEAGQNYKWNATKHCESIKVNLIKILKFSSLYLLIELILETLEIYEPVADWIHQALVYDIAIGSITISMGRILGMIIIIVISFFLANIFKILFENSARANKTLSKGFLFAINKTIGYIIITIGFILGFAYAGIDLGKFGLLAGALGVGIGFGLQNIVNNFISGLILLYERPVEVGDIISAGSLMGEVKSIGVRASKVRTFDGAEVVVPNGNIISNDLINWTLSDTKRRLEIKVGVDYKSNPNDVLKILQKVVVNHDRVLADPAPSVFFDEFGDSSLNFRLLAWVNFNDSLSTKSELSIAVYNALSEAGITIPFPQLDLHVKNDNFTQKPKVVVPKSPDNSPVIDGEKEP